MVADTGRAGAITPALAESLSGCDGRASALLLGCVAGMTRLGAGVPFRTDVGYSRGRRARLAALPPSLLQHLTTRGVCGCFQAGGKAAGGKPYFVKCGLNHVTKLVESKKAQLVVIAHDVEPIETIVWLPALCRAMDTPYCIVKGKARLGSVVNKKTATCLAVTDVQQADKAELATLCKTVQGQFNENEQKLTRTWGGGIMGIKNKARMSGIRKMLAREAAKKAGI